MPLDPDDPRPPYQQVARDLRAAILARRLEPGEKLPSGVELARRYGVARMTVQQAVRLLRDEGLVVSRQGSGVFVRARAERPVGLVPHLGRAFAAEHVSIDFVGCSGETLAGALAGPLDQIRAGRLTPSSLAVRMLLPDGLGDHGAAAVAHAVAELAQGDGVPRAVAEVRRYGVPPAFALYVMNGRDVFFGFYPVAQRAVHLRGGPELLDVAAPDTRLFHHAGDDPDSQDGQYVASAREWFDSVWVTVAPGHRSP